MGASHPGCGSQHPLRSACVLLACRFFPQTLVPMGLAPACGSLFSSIVCILLYRWMKRQNKPTGDKD